ncbi:MAG: oligosaccharide flippase family protein [Actinomycetota bacterium]|nr:oligosaccharide flippase family protein [Actinomycetota bacterium]
MAYDKGCELIRNWKENTVYISLMQLTLLIVNFFLITIISRVYGAETYGEYASAKSLSVLIGTAVVLSLALVVTKGRAQNIEYSKEIFHNSYYLVIRNLLFSLVFLIPLTIIFGRDYSMTSLFLVGFVFNEMIHIALAYYQAQGNFVITSKQILVRTILYGLGAWVIVSQGFSIIWVIVYQALVLFIFFAIAHLYIPKNELTNNVNKETRTKLTKSGRKMVLTSFSSALISELDIVLLGLFYSGTLLGVLAWSRRILEIIFQLLAASLDIIFPELSKANNKKEVSAIRTRLRKVFIYSFSIPILFFLLRGVAGDIFVSLLGNEFSDVSTYASAILFCLPVMVWSRINIIFSRALNFEINLTKSISIGAIFSYGIYFLMHRIGYNPAVLSIIISQVLIAGLTTYTFRKSYVQ